MAREAVAAEDFAQADGGLRDAARLLAGTRHREALAETVAKLGHHPSFEALLAAPASPTTTADGDDAVRTATALVAEVRKSLRHWALPRRDIAPYVAGIAACYRKARSGLRRGFETGETGQLHKARKSVIHHLHHLEALAALWPSVFKAWVQELNNLRLALGDLNDLDELERAMAETADAEVAEMIARRRAGLLAAAAQASGPLFAEKPKAFAARMEAMWCSATD
jgi:CHAD domain-containing protein